MSPTAAASPKKAVSASAFDMVARKALIKAAKAHPAWQCPTDAYAWLRRDRPLAPTFGTQPQSSRTGR